MRKRDKRRSGNFSWQQLKDRLALLTVNQDQELSEAQTDAIWVQRAQQLSKVTVAAENEESFNALVFQLAGEQYAIEMSAITEVINLAQITFVPGVPGFVLGVISRRGEIFSVIDLLKLFQQSQPGNYQQIIMVETDQMSLGIAIDSIAEIRRFTRREIQAMPLQLSGEQAQFFLGVTSSGVALLNLVELLALSRIVVDQS